MEPKKGRPWSLTQDIIDRIVLNIPYGLRLHTIAGLAQVPHNTLDRWLKKGADDFEENIESLFAQLWTKWTLKRAEKLSLWLSRIELCQANWQALWELVKAVGKEDFGMEATEYKELLAIVTKLTDTVKRIMDNPLQGVVQHGREMDSESNIKE